MSSKLFSHGGNLYETLACRHLIKNGHVIVKRNYTYNRNGAKGEIDVISTKDGKVFLNEVKKRSEFAEGCVSVSQMQRIWTGWEIFLENHTQFLQCDVQIQLILVVNNECNILEII